MLFARFLAENHLLIEPEMGVAITLDECEELAKEDGSDKWALAASFAHGMLPQIFRPDHPVFEVQFAREHRLKLEGLIEGLPLEVFAATDALGWVYQFWQTRKKDEVNRSEVKIGANELPAVTQLFTEPYMVQFLLHNSLGAWWVGRHTDKTCPVELSYLRRAEDGVPAAGEFEGWPDNLEEFRLLDPCCGSGHFMVAAFLMLTPMRMALEGLDATQAVDAVLRENLHGLELDQRCVAIAAFALALEAWRFPDAGGFRTLPKLNLAWCGQPVAGKKEQWLALAEGDSRLEAGMTALYDTFRDAPTLGSLIDPARSVAEDMLTAGFEKLQPLLEKALQEHAGEEEWKETAIAALGLAEATRLLGRHYQLVITNVPYLTRGKQSDRLRKFAETHYPKAKNDLANIFLERCLEFSKDEGAGAIWIVMPQNWLFLTTYKRQREHLLTDVRWELLARLGPGAFETISGEVVNVILLALTQIKPEVEHRLHGIDASAPRGAMNKAEVLRDSKIVAVSQQGQLGNPDARITLDDSRVGALLEEYASSYQGTASADYPRYGRCFWEIKGAFSGEWIYQQSTANETCHFSGREHVLFWESGRGDLANSSTANIQGLKAWDKWGVAIAQMRQIPVTLHVTSSFDNNIAAIIPRESNILPAIWCFCSSPEYNEAVRRIDQKMNVTNATLVKVPFDLEHWTKVAQESYPQGLPKPYTDDATQWVFHGHPCDSVVWDNENRWTAVGPRRTDGATVLQISVARLLGYRWPAENDSDMELADAQRAIVEKTKTLYPLEDVDGIVCIPSVRGERPAQSAYCNCYTQHTVTIGMMESWPNCLPNPTTHPLTTGCAINSSMNTASCFTTVLSSGTSGMAASATASMPLSTTTSCARVMVRAGGCWSRSPIATSATGSLGSRIALSAARAVPRIASPRRTS